MLTIPHGVIGLVKYICGMAMGGKINHIGKRPNLGPGLIWLR